MYKMDVLKCLEGAHTQQTGQILKLLIPNFLKTYQEAVSREAVTLASRKIEVLLTLPSENVVQQLSKEDILSMQNHLVKLKLLQK